MSLAFAGQTSSLTPSTPPLGRATGTPQADPTPARPSPGTTTDLPNNGRDIPPPPSPKSLEEAGLSPVMVSELLLKFLSVRGTGAGHELACDLGLQFPLIESILIHLKDQKLIEVNGGDLMGPV